MSQARHLEVLPCPQAFLGASVTSSLSVFRGWDLAFGAELEQGLRI